MSDLQIMPVFLQARPLKEPVSFGFRANRIPPSVQRFHDLPHSVLSFFRRASSSPCRGRACTSLRLDLANFNFLQNRQVVVVVCLPYPIRLGFASSTRRRYTGRCTAMAFSYNSSHLRNRKRRIRPSILAKLWEWVRSSSPLKTTVEKPHFGLARKVSSTVGMSP